MDGSWLQNRKLKPKGLKRVIQKAEGPWERRNGIGNRKNDDKSGADNARSPRSLAPSSCRHMNSPPQLQQKAGYWLWGELERGRIWSTKADVVEGGGENQDWGGCFILCSSLKTLEHKFVPSKGEIGGFLPTSQKKRSADADRYRPPSEAAQSLLISLRETHHSTRPAVQLFNVPLWKQTVKDYWPFEERL